MNPLEINDLLNLIVKQLDHKAFYACSLVNKAFNGVTKSLEPLKRREFLDVSILYNEFTGFLHTYHVLPNGKKEGKEEYYSNDDELCLHMIMWKNGEMEWHKIYSGDDIILREYYYKNGKLVHTKFWNKDGPVEYEFKK